jgi:cell division protein FtsL
VFTLATRNQTYVLPPLRVNYLSSSEITFSSSPVVFTAHLPIPKGSKREFLLVLFLTLVLPAVGAITITKHFHRQALVSEKAKQKEEREQYALREKIRVESQRKKQDDPVSPVAHAKSKK